MLNTLADRNHSQQELVSNLQKPPINFHQDLFQASDTNQTNQESSKTINHTILRSTAPPNLKIAFPPSFALKGESINKNKPGQKVQIMEKIENKKDIDLVLQKIGQSKTLVQNTNHVISKSSKKESESPFLKIVETIHANYIDIFGIKKEIEEDEIKKEKDELFEEDSMDGDNLDIF